MQANLKNYKFIKKFVRLASITCVTLAIYGCSSTEENINNEQSMTPEQQQLFILEKVESWSAAESDVERVLALEADMQLIIDQLASMSELGDDPLGDDDKTESHEKTENINNNKNPTELLVNTDISNTVEENKSTSSIYHQKTTYSSSQRNSNVKAASKSLGHYFPRVGIHIAMFKDVESVTLGWQYFQTILPAIINKKPLIAKVNYEDTEYYSLRVGPFKSVNSAKNTCINIQNQQHYCSVVEYKGFGF